MDMHKMASGGANIILVCDTYCRTCSDNNVRSFIDVQFDMSSMTPYLMTSRGITDLSNVEYFDDVVITDNYVVSVAHKNQSGGAFYRLFNKPSALGFDIFFGTSAWQTIHCESTFNDDLLATHLSADKFAIVSHAHSNFSWGTQIAIFSGSTYVSKYFIDQQSLILDPQWKIKEIRSDVFSNNLYILQDMQYPIGTSTINSVMAKINLTGALLTFDGYFNTTLELQSFDNNLSNRSRMIGYGIASGHLELSQLNYQSSPCFSRSNSPLSVLSGNVSEFLYNPSLDNFQLIQTTHIASIRVTNLIQTCE